MAQLYTRKADRKKLYDSYLAALSP